MDRGTLGGVLMLTPRAAEALRAAIAAAHRFDPAAAIRLRSTRGGLAVELTDGPADDEVEVTIDGLALIVTDGLDGTVDTGEHNVFTLLP